MTITYVTLNEHKKVTFKTTSTQVDAMKWYLLYALKVMFQGIQISGRAVVLMKMNYRDRGISSID